MSACRTISLLTRFENLFGTILRNEPATVSRLLSFQSLMVRASVTGRCLIRSFQIEIGEEIGIQHGFMDTRT